MKATVGAFNKAEEDYRASRDEGSVPIENVPPETLAWVCDFAGEFGLPGTPSSHARVVLKEAGQTGGLQGAEGLLKRILLYAYYKEPPPPVSET